MKRGRGRSSAPSLWGGTSLPGIDSIKAFEPAKHWDKGEDLPDGFPAEPSFKPLREFAADKISDSKEQEKFRENLLLHISELYKEADKAGYDRREAELPETPENENSPKSKNGEDKKITDSRAFWAVMGIVGGAAIAALVAWLIARNMKHHLQAEIQQLKQATQSGNG
jgi:hypothetical protein